MVIIYLEVLQEAIFSLVTSVSRGREAAHHHRSNCQDDGSLWESHTPCRCSDTWWTLHYGIHYPKHLWNKFLAKSEWNCNCKLQNCEKTVTCPLTAYCHLHKTPPRCNTPRRNGLHQTPPPFGWWDGDHPLCGTCERARAEGLERAHCYCRYGGYWYTAMHCHADTSLQGAAIQETTLLQPNQDKQKSWVISAM